MFNQSGGVVLVQIKNLSVIREGYWKIKDMNAIYLIVNLVSL